MLVESELSVNSNLSPMQEFLSRHGLALLDAEARKQTKLLGGGRWNPITTAAALCAPRGTPACEYHGGVHIA